jgi:hypothetical protein
MIVRVSKQEILKKAAQLVNDDMSKPMMIFFFRSNQLG